MSEQLLITAGRGPEECELVVDRLARILTAEAASAGLGVTRGATVRGSGRRGDRSIVLVVDGVGSARWAASVSGPVQWIATSPLRPRHQRRNWFVQVVSLGTGISSGSASGSRAFDERDVTFQPVRSGGPGGQRRNKVATAVRAEHVPSGRVVVASGERTLSANRSAALLRLADLAAREARRGERQDAARQRGHHDQVVRGTPVRTIRAPLG
jgi:peptide chain release factor